MNSIKEAMTKILDGASNATTYLQEDLGELWEHLQQAVTSSWTSCHHYMGVFGEHLESVFTVARENLEEISPSMVAFLLLLLLCLLLPGRLGFTFTFTLP